MGQIPGRVHQPRQANVTVRLEATIDDGSYERGIEQLPDSETSTQIDARCAGYQHGVQGPPSGLRHERHREHEDRGADCGSDGVHYGEGGRRRVPRLHGLESIEPVIMGQWLKRQYPKESSQGGGNDLVWWP